MFQCRGFSLIYRHQNKIFYLNPANGGLEGDTISQFRLKHSEKRSGNV